MSGAGGCGGISGVFGEMRSYRNVTHDVKRNVAIFTRSPIEAPATGLKPNIHAECATSPPVFEAAEQAQTSRILAVPQRLGVFGGTFDPPHRGHLAVAEAARDVLGCDRVLLVVANDPWKKSPQREVTPAADRLALVQAMLRDADPARSAALEACDMEIRRGGPSYTVTTLRELRAAHPDAELFLVIGRDLVDQFPSWHESAQIERLATIVVVDRPGFVADLRRGWKTLQVPAVDVSSTELRAALQSGDENSKFLTPSVAEEIRARGLYGVVTAS